MNHNIENKYTDEIEKLKTYITKLEKRFKIFKNNNIKREYEFKIVGNVGVTSILALF